MVPTDIIHTLHSAALLRTMSPSKATRSGRSGGRHVRAVTPTRPGPAYARRACTKRKLNYNEDSEDADSDRDSNEGSRKKRFRGVSSEDNGTEESPASSPFSRVTQISPYRPRSRADNLFVPVNGAAAKIFRGLPAEVCGPYLL